MIRQVLRALGVLLAVCLVVRACWYLVEPLLPVLGGLFVFVGIAYLLFSGPRIRG